jgi:hypothetical protein
MLNLSSAGMANSGVPIKTILGSTEVILTQGEAVSKGAPVITHKSED